MGVYHIRKKDHLTPSDLTDLYSLHLEHGIMLTPLKWHSDSRIMQMSKSFRNLAACYFSPKIRSAKSGRVNLFGEESVIDFNLCVLKLTSGSLTVS